MRYGCSRALVSIEVKEKYRRFVANNSASRWKECGTRLAVSDREVPKTLDMGMRSQVLFRRAGSVTFAYNNAHVAERVAGLLENGAVTVRSFTLVETHMFLKVVSEEIVCPS